MGHLVTGTFSASAAPPDLPRIPRFGHLVVLGSATLLMVVLAVASSIYELHHEHDVHLQYLQAQRLTQLAFDAESLAARMRSLRSLSQPVATGEPSAALREALQSLDVDRGEWERRVGEALAQGARGLESRLTRVQEALGALRAMLAQAAPAQPAGAEAAVAAATQSAQIDHAYLNVVEAAQAAMTGSVHAEGDRIALAGHTVSEISAALAVAASVLALVFGAVVAALIHRSQHESRTTIGVMGELLRTDPLTGITNRRGLDENLPIEMARAKRGGAPLTVAMIDLDYFKRYNSRRGHAGGDSLLRIAAQGWRRQLRPTDTLVRYGGEEFTLVLPACDAEQACQLIARLRPILPDNQTFSAGVATWNHAESAEGLLQRADRSLLMAKKQGRNRTIVSGHEEQAELPLMAR